MTEPTKFIILSYPRSGSGNLCDMINNHPSIICGREELNFGRLRKKGYVVNRNYSNSVEIRTKATIDFLNQDECKVVGFKLFPSHIDPFYLDNQLSKNGIDIKYIYLERESLWDMSISLAFARYFRKHHVKLEQNIEDIVYPTIIPIPLLSAALSKIKFCYDRITVFFKEIPHLKITYNDGDYENIDSIFDYLGVDKIELISNYKRVNIDNFYQRYVLNYDELKEVYNTGMNKDSDFLKAKPISSKNNYI